MTKTIYIASLHRPFNQQLKASKWVCEFVASSRHTISSSALTTEFYYYLITFLEKIYQKAVPENFNGLPSDAAIKSINEYILLRGKTEFIEELPSIIKSRNTPVQKQIYSTYKAASYFVNLAKDKFDLLNEKNSLTAKGSELLQLRSGFFDITDKEASFYFERILRADFHLFLTHCLFLKLQKKHNLKTVLEHQIEFVHHYLGIKHFTFTNASISNYNVVRQAWVESLNVVDTNANFRKKYLDLIQADEYFITAFSELKTLFTTFEKETFKAKSSYRAQKQKFQKLYRHLSSSSFADQGFINLYDIKASMKISGPNFQKFLINFYEEEKNVSNIYFSNPVTSIDRRERFYIRNRPVLKIKIK